MWLVYNKTKKMAKNGSRGRTDKTQKRRNEETHNLSEVGRYNFYLDVLSFPGASSEYPATSFTFVEML